MGWLLIPAMFLTVVIWPKSVIGIMGGIVVVAMAIAAY